MRSDWFVGNSSCYAFLASVNSTWSSASADETAKRTKHPRPVLLLGQNLILVGMNPLRGAPVDNDDVEAIFGSEVSDDGQGREMEDHDRDGDTKSLKFQRVTAPPDLPAGKTADKSKTVSDYCILITSTIMQLLR